MATKKDNKDLDILTSSISDGKDAKKVKQGAKKGITITKSTQKIIKIVVAVILVVALVAGYFATGICRNGILATFDVPQKVLAAATITDSDGVKHSVKVSTYNYYYASTYNNMRSQQEQYEQYGLDLDTVGLNVDFDEKLSNQTTTKEDGTVITWAQYLEDSVIESIRQTYLYYYEAIKANDGQEPEITADQEAEIEESLAEFEETANSYGYTLSAYLRLAMGKGVNEEVFRRESKIAYIADNYKTEYEADLASNSYTDDDVKTYLNENKDDYITVDALMFEANSEDDAKAFISKLKDDGSNFADLCVEYSEDDFSKKVFADEAWVKEIAVTKQTLINKGYAIATAAEHTHEEGEEHSDDEEGLYPGLDWLYDSSRKAGDTYQQSTTVVYLLKPASVSNIKTIDVRHILVSPNDDSSSATEADDDAWAEALTQAQSILQEYNDGEKTADSFAALAQEYSIDGSASNGGLYEDVYPGQMVSSFNAWCFDDSRKVGDVDIVMSEYGYHIMYFEETNDQTVWDYSIRNILASEESTDVFAELEEAYTIKPNAFGSLYFQKDVDIDS